MGIKRDYADEYAGRTGTIEGEGDLPVTIGPINLSTFCVPERAAQFGCPPNTLAILVTWLPAGLVREGADRTDGQDLVDLARIPDPAEWVVFPKVFDGVPVYYLRGHIIRPQGT